MFGLQARRCQEGVRFLPETPCNAPLRCIARFKFLAGAPLRFLCLLTPIQVQYPVASYENLPGGSVMKQQVGQQAPNFTLKSHLGQEHTLSEFRGKNVVIAFFPLAWTPI